MHLLSGPTIPLSSWQTLAFIHQHLLLQGSPILSQSKNRQRESYHTREAGGLFLGGLKFESRKWTQNASLLFLESRDPAINLYCITNLKTEAA